MTRRENNKYTKHKAMVFTILALAWPTIIEQALQTIVQYADSSMVGKLGAQASATVGLTTTVTWLVNSPMFAMGIGVLACISRYLGAKEKKNATLAAQQSVIITLVLGTLLTIITLLISPALPRWLGAEPAIRKQASMYFTIVCIPMIFRTANIMFGSVLRATGDTKTPMFVNLLMNFINIILNYLLIYSSGTITLGSVSIPTWGAGLGVIGAAMATAISYVIGGILMTIAFYRNETLEVRFKEIRYNKTIMNHCIRIGIPIAFERIAVYTGQVVFTSLVTGLGTISFAAHSIALTAEQAFYIPGVGMQAAASTMAGNALGEGDEKKLAHMSATILIMTVAIMTITGGLLFFMPSAMMSFFTSDPEVIRKGAMVLRLVAISEPIFGASIIMEGIFNGVGDTKTPFVFAVFSMWGVRILFTFLCVNVWNLGLVAVWCCMIGDNVVRGILMGIRFIRGSWKKATYLGVKPVV